MKIEDYNTLNIDMSKLYKNLDAHANKLFEIYELTEQILNDYFRETGGGKKVSYTYT